MLQIPCCPANSQAECSLRGKFGKISGAPIGNGWLEQHPAVWEMYQGRGLRSALDACRTQSGLAQSLCDGQTGSIRIYDPIGRANCAGQAISHNHARMVVCLDLGFSRCALPVGTGVRGFFHAQTAGRRILRPISWVALASLVICHETSGQRTLIGSD